MKLDPTKLEKLVAKIFASRGCHQEEAGLIAEHLVGSNLRGYDSHGIVRVPEYIQSLNDGNLIANRSLEWVLDTGAIAIADGQMGSGLSLARDAVYAGVERARQHGVSIVGLRNCGHLGRIGHWSTIAANQGIVALHFVNSSGKGMFVVPAGGLDPRLSVNVISAGIPVRGKDPVVLDISAAAAAEGKIMVARNEGASVPEGWIIDAEGRPTTDPNEFYGPPRGAILPFGGHKGFGLGLIIDLLAGALTGGGCSAAGKTRLEQSMLGIYIDPDKMNADDSIADEVLRYIEFVRSSRPVEASSKVRLPGENAERLRKMNSSAMTVDESTWMQLVQVANKCGIDDSLVSAALIADSCRRQAGT